MTEIIPKLHEKCPICHSEYRFIIQKALDEDDIEKLAKFDISPLWLTKHKTEDHRSNLIAWGAMDAKIRNKGVKVGETLSDFILKWRKGLEQRPDKTIKDSDAINALKLFSQIEGSLVNKHEVTIKKSIKELFNEILDCDEGK